MTNDESGFSYFRLRIPADLKAMIEHAARANNRSLNAQVLAFIDAALEAEETTEQFARRLDMFEAELRGLKDARERIEKVLDLK